MPGPGSSRYASDGFGVQQPDGAGLAVGDGGVVGEAVGAAARGEGADRKQEGRQPDHKWSVLPSVDSGDW